MRLVKPTFLLLLIISAGILIIAQCTSNSQKIKTAETQWLNHGDSAKYVGIQTCRQCHADIYETFIKTGMGQSFGAATREKSAANFNDFGHLYDSVLDFHYNIYWRDDSLWVSEYRLKEGKALKQGLVDYPSVEVPFLRQHYIDYVVGSGQHTNSHIFSENGYLYQAPFTFYTQSQKLDLPPGFEHGNNSRFSRPIGLECMSCHNAMPTGFVAGSENRFDEVPKGIDCERCHGPGSVHVNRIQRGIAVDTSKGPDRSIVNPKRLTSQLQFELCQRCHLQGNTVLAENKSFFDFKPGMYLDSIMDIYLPRYSTSDNEFIMASHVDRFKLSACFLESDNKFVCTSCHNPHVSVQSVNTDIFNGTCKNCHADGTEKHACTADFEDMDIAEINCVECHMPSSGSIDIPHVTVHDHYIRKPEKEKADTQLVEKVFMGLAAINTKKPGKRSRIKAYLQQFERFEPNPVFLDSAEMLLSRVDLEQYKQEWIHLYYLKDEPSGIVKTVEENGKASTWLVELNSKSWDNADAWTAYRIAEAYRKFNDYNIAFDFIERAVELAPNHPDFQVKKGSIYALKGKYVLAQKTYENVLAQNSLLVEAWSDLSYVLLAQNEILEAEEAALKARNLDPDYQQAKVNLASVYLAQKRWAEARMLLEEILLIDPNNKRVNGALDYLNAQNLGV